MNLWSNLNSDFLLDVRISIPELSFQGRREPFLCESQSEIGLALSLVVRLFPSKLEPSDKELINEVLCPFVFLIISNFCILSCKTVRNLVNSLIAVSTRPLEKNCRVAISWSKKMLVLLQPKQKPRPNIQKDWIIVDFEILEILIVVNVEGHAEV